MTEWEKAQAGLLYDANYDESLIALRERCAELCYDFNNCRPADTERQRALLNEIFGSVKGAPVVTAPFYCDYGSNISLGKNFYCNHNCCILDGAKVTVGDNVFLAPNCVLTTAGHALDRELRGRGLEFAKPITIEDDVWLGANVTVLPGVTVGAGSVIGAGSVVTKDVPPGVIAVGNPCRVLREISAADRDKYPME